MTTVRFFKRIMRPVAEEGIISLPEYKREGYFPFKRKMVGTSVRYRNTDLTRYILSHDDTEE